MCCGAAAVFFGSHALDANPLLIAKPPDDVRSAVTNRPRQVLEMDFGARDEEISQELTEGGAFRTRPWLRVSSEFHVVL